MGRLSTIFICVVFIIIGFSNAGIWKSPLMLTPYIEQERFDEAKRMSWSAPLAGEVESFAGMFDVNNHTGSKMFFWFFPSEDDPKRDPFLVWLNGMPFSSVDGVFMVNGPYIFDGKKIGRRTSSWQKNNNVLYIDSPVGIGFSQPNSKTAIEYAFEDIGSNLHNVIVQFFKIFPIYRENELYLTGTSYAAKSLALLAREMSDSQWAFNLKGMFVANPIIDPEIQLSHADFLYQWGLIDQPDLSIFREREKLAHESIASQDASGVFKAYNNYIISMTGDDTLLTNTSGPLDPLAPTYDAPEKHYIKLFSKPWVRNALHVGNTPFESDIYTNADFMDAMMPYFSISVKEIYEELLSQIKVMLYVGQAEILASYPNVAELAASFSWDGQDQFNESKRKPIFVQETLAGFKKSYSNLSVVMLRNAGHNVISDQPERTLALLKEFTTSEMRKY